MDVCDLNNNCFLIHLPEDTNGYFLNSEFLIELHDGVIYGKMLYLPGVSSKMYIDSCLKMINILPEPFLKYIHVLFTVIPSISDILAVSFVFLLLRCTDSGQSERLARGGAPVLQLPIRNYCHFV